MTRRSRIASLILGISLAFQGGLALADSLPEPSTDWDAEIAHLSGYHLAGWGAWTAGLGGLETGCLIASSAQAPGWFQCATFNLAWLAPSMAGFFATLGVHDGVGRWGGDPQEFARRLRGASIALSVVSGVLVTLATPALVAASWDLGQFEAFGILSIPLSVLTTAAVLGYWSIKVDQSVSPKRRNISRRGLPRPELVAASPVGLVLVF